MAAMTWLALPGQCGIGGDAFAVVREPDGRVWTVNGSGFGPDGGTAEFYRDKGLSSIPLDGPLAVAVPGRPRALAALHAHGAHAGAGRPVGAGRRGSPRTACRARPRPPPTCTRPSTRYPRRRGPGRWLMRRHGAPRTSATGCPPTRSGPHHPPAGPRPGRFYTASSPSARSRRCAPAGRRSAATNGPPAATVPAERGDHRPLRRRDRAPDAAADCRDGWCCSRPRCATASSGSPDG